MDRVWQRLWDRHPTHYAWVVVSVTSAFVVVVLMTQAYVVLAVEASHRYLLAGAASVAATISLVVVALLPRGRCWRMVGRWAAGGETVDGEAVLRATYAYARAAVLRAVVAGAIAGAALLVAVAAMAGARGARLVEYALLGGTIQLAVQLVAVHSFVESALRPVRLALTTGVDMGDDLPRARPTFATWSTVMVIATAWVFAATGSAFAGVVGEVDERPWVIVAIATAATIAFAAPITAFATFAPLLRPIRDLAEGTERVAAGDYSRRLPVVQDDDLGALAGSFNRMQAGLAERQRLQAAFGTYVDPTLAARLLGQGDDVFTGERRVVTVMFVDIRDFTPFAEANTAEDTVSQLNALFEIVVPAVIEAGGHVNKFLGDGALAVFGAPNELPAHADTAVASARSIQRLVANRFGGELRIGIGINTGVVIAGTIGGGGKLEFTLIGDTVNVAARVEQLTKETGDPILVTQDTVDAMHAAPKGLTARGAHPLKGKSAPVHLFGLSPGA